MAYLSSTASWSTLARLRQRGQRPAWGVFVTDHPAQRHHLEESGAFAVGLPSPEHAYLVSGLDVVIIADFTPKTVDVARRFLSANPAYFATYFRGRGLSVVIERAA